jgi:hypothetical protein
MEEVGASLLLVVDVSNEMDALALLLVPELGVTGLA